MFPGVIEPIIQFPDYLRPCGIAHSRWNKTSHLMKLCVVAHRRLPAPTRSIAIANVESIPVFDILLQKKVTMKTLLAGRQELMGTRLSRLAYRSLTQKSYALGRLLIQQTSHPLFRPTVVIGAIASSTQKPINAAVQYGFSSAGVDTVLCGLLPIPAIAYLTRANKHQACVVVNDAWHPDWDGYVGFFSPEGTRLSRAAPVPTCEPKPQKNRLQQSRESGTISQLSRPGAAYIEFCKSSAMPQLNLDGLHIVIDSAHSSAREVAPKVLQELGAQVFSIGLNARGLNEAETAGANVPQQLAWTVRALRADVGISINREGNGLKMVDATGQLHCENKLRSLATIGDTPNTTDDAIIRALQVLALMQASGLSLLEVMLSHPACLPGSQQAALPT